MDREVIFEHRKVSFMDSGLAKSANEFLSQRSQTVVNLRKQKRLESVRHKRIKQTSSPNSNLTLERVIHELDLNAV